VYFNPSCGICIEEYVSEAEQITTSIDRLGDLQEGRPILAIISLPRVGRESMGTRVRVVA